MEKNQRIKYGSLIADMRRIRHITQRELASLSGVSYANISRIELGKYSPGLDVIQRIEDALEIERIYVTKNNIIMGTPDFFLLGSTNNLKFLKVLQVLPCFKMVEISKDKTIISAIWNEDYEMEYDEPEIEIEALLANQNWCCGDPEEYPAGSKCWWYIMDLEPEDR